MRHRDREGIERLERNGTMAQPPDQPVVCLAEADLLDRQGAQQLTHNRRDVRTVNPVPGAG